MRLLPSSTGIIRVARTFTVRVVGICVFTAVASMIVLALQAHRPNDIGNLRLIESAPTAAEVLIVEHGCWTGEAPADMRGKIPGHVVVTLAGRTVYGGSRLTGKALEQIFDGADHGLTVHAFCR